MPRASWVGVAVVLVWGCVTSPEEAAQLEAMLATTGDGPSDEDGCEEEGGIEGGETICVEETWDVCAEEHGPGWDSAYDSFGRWIGCTCTSDFLCGEGGGSGGGGPPSPPGGGSGGGDDDGDDDDDDEQLERCFAVCDGQAPQNETSCRLSGYVRSPWEPACPFPDPAQPNRCMGAAEMCHRFGRVEGGPVVPHEWEAICDSPRTQEDYDTCAQFPVTCVDDWLRRVVYVGGHPRTHEAACRAVRTRQHNACYFECVRRHGRDGMRCQVTFLDPDDGEPRGATGVSSGNTCCPASGPCYSCVAPEEQRCDYGDERAMPMPDWGGRRVDVPVENALPNDGPAPIRARVRTTSNVASQAR